MLKVILIILGVLLLLFVAFAFWLPSFIMTGKRQTLKEAFDWQTNHYDTSFYKDLEKTDYTVKGSEDYELHVQYLRNAEPTTKYIIISHGYTDNRMGSLKYVQMYLDLGFNCIIYDLRGHGENESTFTTYGVREGADLKCLVEDTRERYPDITVLGLHGESLGSATTITSLKYKPDVDFVVADCGFSDIENVLKEGYRNAHVPTWLVDIANVTGKIRYHYAIKDMRPIESLNDNEIPILFIHGENDTFILPQNSEDMAARTKGYKELYIIPGAGHAESILTEPEMYKEYVEQYLVTLGILEDGKTVVTQESKSENVEEGKNMGAAKLYYQGHASARIETAEGKVIYIDPFAGDGYDLAADLILETHSHFDHTGTDLIEVKNDDCSIITWKEALKGGEYQTFDFDYVKVEAVEAGYNKNHNVNECVGFVLTFSDGVKVYFSGDTSKTPQMAKLEGIDYAFFCCDGVYNMDTAEASECAKLVGAKHSIPYHMIPADPQNSFNQSVAESFVAEGRIIIKPGEELVLEK